MLGLTIRDEFKGRRLKGTAIELANKNNTGATQVPASDFLRITYPSIDVLKMLEASGPDQARPIVLKGERGQGKSHLMATLYHALTDSGATTAWLTYWRDTLSNQMLDRVSLRPSMHVVSESLHQQHYKTLWDLVFDKHPHGAYCKGKWEAEGDKKTDVPSDTIIMEMLQHTPMALILDEFQTWFDGLTNSKQNRWQTWAFNFIQILSEIAKEHPDRLLLVVSVRNGKTDAFQQIQRVNPVIVDFTGITAKQDRARLLLHRLFENRLQVPRSQIESIIKPHAEEYFRLRNTPPAEHARLSEEFIEMWPYATHLMKLLEDQVLIATSAQGTRDLIRILADLFKRVGEKVAVITAADFQLDDDRGGMEALLDSVANHHHAKLREKALRNLEAVRDAVPDYAKRLPHLEGILGSLWLRSLADINQAGADQATLQVDLTRDRAVDDNAFQVELSTIVENSFNIHEDGNRYIFKEEENPQAKLIASARNDRLFQEGQDTAKLAKETRYVIGGSEDMASRFRVIVLPQVWQREPWASIDEADHPSQWDDRLPILVLPEAPTKPEAAFGRWVRDYLPKNRNAVRFLLPQDGSTNIFGDRDLIVLARCVHLAEQWKTQNTEYSRLQAKYQKELRDILKARFDRFAILANWNFQQPDNCRFYIEPHRAQGTNIPDAIEKLIGEDLFIPEDFEEFILVAAENNEAIGKLLRELREPRPGGKDCIPWLGETLVKERIIRLCAKGKIAINLRGQRYLQQEDHESEEMAWRRLKGQLGTGRHLDETHVLLPQSVPGTGGVNMPARPTGGVAGGGLQPGGDPSGAGGTGVPGGSSGGTGGGTYGGGAGPAPGGIFGASTTRVPIDIPATSSLNLLGRIESQGIRAGTQIHNLHLKIGKLTGAQLQELIKKLPDGMTYELGLEKEQVE
ncbi:MAG: DUF499 domain-containing protein [Phycisphaerales bacterium]